VNVALVGCGHIGGSFAFALKARGVARRVVGQDRSDEAAARAARAQVLAERP
jgi:prephenate dehydrogenase